MAGCSHRQRQNQGAEPRPHQDTWPVPRGGTWGPLPRCRPLSPLHMGSSQQSVSVSPTYRGDEEEHSPPEGDHTALVSKPEPTLEGDLWGHGRVWVQAACQRDADDGGVQADRGCGPSSPPSLCTPGFLGMLPPIPSTRLNWATRFSQQDVYGRCKQRPQQGLLACASSLDLRRSSLGWSVVPGGGSEMHRAARSQQIPDQGWWTPNLPHAGD